MHRNLTLHNESYFCKSVPWSLDFLLLINSFYVNMVVYIFLGWTAKDSAIQALTESCHANDSKKMAKSPLMTSMAAYTLYPSYCSKLKSRRSSAMTSLRRGRCKGQQTRWGAWAAPNLQRAGVLLRWEGKDDRGRVLLKASWEKEDSLRGNLGGDHQA